MWSGLWIRFGYWIRLVHHNPQMQLFEAATTEIRFKIVYTLNHPTKPKRSKNDNFFPL